MKIMGLGLKYETGDLLVAPMEEDEFSNRLIDSFPGNQAPMRKVTDFSTRAFAFRGEVERERSVDLADPRAAGWTYLVNVNDPQRQAIQEAIEPLAQWRGMADVSKPLPYEQRFETDWLEWQIAHYNRLVLGTRPHYVLIVGGPDQVPFHFQSLLDSLASVGRIEFDSIDDLKTYVDKVIRLEQAPAPAVTRDCLFFGPDGGPTDPTYFSRRYMVEPLAEHVNTTFGLSVKKLVGADATKEKLIEALAGARPAIVYTASHGLGPPEGDLELQKRYTGAICCQHGYGQPVLEWLYGAEDVPTDVPFLEGSIFFQFACFGYGTPAMSDFEHWLGEPGINAHADFVSALPKKLLAHPQGPIAFVGHLDSAWLHGFQDPDNPHIMDRWHRRIEPFVYAVDQFLKVFPSGLGMTSMNERYTIGNALISNAIDGIQSGEIEVTPEFRSRLADTFIMRSDAQNYMIFGDPAARLRIPGPA